MIGDDELQGVVDGSPDHEGEEEGEEEEPLVHPGESPQDVEEDPGAGQGHLDLVLRFFHRFDRRAKRVGLRFQGISGKLLRKAIVRELIDYQVGSLLEYCGPALAASNFANAREARLRETVIRPSRTMVQLKTELEAFLHHRVYRHPQLLTVRQQARQQLQKMFQGYLERPELLPTTFQLRSTVRGLPRSVGEYLAGMTDRYCDQQYERWFRNPTR